MDSVQLFDAKLINVWVKREYDFIENPFVEQEERQ